MIYLKKCVIHFFVLPIYATMILQNGFIYKSKVKKKI